MSYTYDDRNRLKTAMDYASCGIQMGGPDLCFSHIYDDEGYLIAENVTVGGCNGPPYDCYLYIYDENGSLITKEYDKHCDDATDVCYSYTYPECD